jgi:energy-converting hydrogenase Eha subunit H
MMEYWDEGYGLPLVASVDETQLTMQLGPAGLRTIDANLVRHVEERSRKVLRVVADAMKAGAFSIHDEACFELHVRRLIGLVERGVVVGLGNLRRPGFSEVCLPG